MDLSVCIVNVSEIWIVIIGALGLLLTLGGSLTIIAPDIPYLKNHLQVTGRVRAIEAGRDQLFDNGQLIPDDPGYGELSSIMKDHVGVSKDPAKIEVFKGNTRRAEVYGRHEVYIAVEDSDGNYHVGSGSDIPAGVYQMHNVGPSTLVQELISRKGERMTKDPFLRKGAVAMVTGFFLQLVAYLSLNICV